MTKERYGWHRRSKGFTLVELLVVISIIALLLAILMPALSKVRQQSQSLVCKARLSQCHLALTLYAANNDDKYLEQEWSSPTDYWHARLAKYVAGYAPNVQGWTMYPFLMCPSGPAYRMYGRGSNPPIAFKWEALDYGLNAASGKISNFKRPGEFAPFFDFTGATGAVWEAIYFVNTAQRKYYKQIMRHNRGLNAVYLDGHVEHIRNAKWADLVP
jgi:prepilin-type N-terminal cleavage/methylation domain-containing protein/prepilin-type processing-associated H-X9-DG protein